MIKLANSVLKDEHLVESHTEQTGTNWIQYNITTTLDRVDQWEVLATVLGGSEFYPLFPFYIYDPSNYYSVRAIWLDMDSGSPKDWIFYLHRINAGQSSYDLKFVFYQNN